MDVNSRDPLQNIIPFRIKGVEISRFDSSGNLKIGTTTTTAPTVRLDISGGAARVNSGTATSTALTTTGRIGVNTAVPTVDLEVNGLAKLGNANIIPLYVFTSHTFTNAGTTGRHGPTLSVVRSAYSSFSWAQNNSYLSMTNDNGIQLWTVPISGNYTIRAKGAAGLDTRGGKGRDIQLTTTLIKGEVIRILVGQQGTVAGNFSSGGGGTFVVRGITPIIVAGGGGGRGDVMAYENNPFSDANIGTVGNTTPGGWYGGSDGEGGDGQQQGGGGGFLINNAPYARGGNSFISGGAGGLGTVDGGFGGGGGTYVDFSGGAGGGGYSGGGGGGTVSGFNLGGGGGGSYGITTLFDRGAINTDHGSVEITLTTPSVALEVIGVAVVTASSATSTALTTTGRIGVNTAAPTTELDVMGTARLTASSATATALTTTGRIGVNTATPTVALDVSGEGNILTGLTIGSTANSSNVGGLSEKLSIYHATDARIYLTHGSNQGMLISNNSTNSLIAHRGPGGEFVLNCEQNRPMKFKTTNTDRMTILGDGKVGIGTTTPAVALDVSGAARMSASSATATALTTVGWIGVNTAGPTVALDVYGAARLTASSATATALTTVGWIGVNTATPTVALDVSGAARLTASSATSTALTTTGRIGVNTATLGADLDVSGTARLTASSTTATALTTTGRIGVNTSTPSVELDVSGIVNVSNYISVGSGSSGSGATTSILPNAFYVRTGGTNWRDYIPLLSADSTTNILVWGGPDDQWYLGLSLPNEIGKQYSYFAAYWLNANRAVVGTSFSVESYAGVDGQPPTSSRGLFTFTATAVTDGRVTAYTGLLSQGGYGLKQLTAQQDGIDAGVARRSLSNRTLLMGGNVETGYLSVRGTARLTASSTTATALTTTGRIGVNTTTPTVELDVSGVTRIRNHLFADSRLYVGTDMSMSIVTGTEIGYDSEGFSIWNYRNGIIRFGTSLNERMRISAIGNVGIGTDAPLGPLHVAITRSVAIGTTAFYGFPENVSYWVGRWAGGTYNVAIISGGDLWVQGNYIWVSSDKRIKRNIRDIEGTTALSQVRKIRPKVYNYIDHTKGTQDIYGFIAQDTEDIITYSSNIVKDYIPNFYCKGIIDTIDQTNHIYEISTENELKFEKVLDTSGNEISNYKIKLYDATNKEYICNVIHRNDAKTIRVKCDKEFIFSTIEEYKNAVFIYGQEVNDFYNLDKNAIFTVATAALQEVDRQQQADKVRIAELEATVRSQQSLINDILERLNKNGL